MEDPDLIKIPKFFLKISNSYFMSVSKYTNYLRSFLTKKRKKANMTNMTTNTQIKN